MDDDLFVSGWCGFVGAQIVLPYAPDLAFPVAGLAGWLGGQSIDFVKADVEKKLP
jgi:hypothetical protein